MNINLLHLSVTGTNLLPQWEFLMFLSLTHDNHATHTSPWLYFWSALGFVVLLSWKIVLPRLLCPVRKWTRFVGAIYTNYCQMALCCFIFPSVIVKFYLTTNNACKVFLRLHVQYLKITMNSKWSYIYTCMYMYESSLA